MHFDNPTTSRIPIPQISLAEQETFVQKAQVILELNRDLQGKKSRMVDYFVDEFQHYYKPKTKKQTLEEYKSLKTGTDYKDSIPELERVANHNEALASKLKRQVKPSLSQKDIQTIKNRLENWYKYPSKIADIFAIMQKSGIDVSPKLKFEFNEKFHEKFNAKADECRFLELQITQTDLEIDKMVYELYGLSDDEIKVVEGF
jgi:hypothetical protein